MDIAEISMNLSQNQLLTAVGTAMLGKTLDVVEGQAEALTKSMDMNSPSLESLVYPTSGTMIDMRI
ncbi:MAG: YjfB family protein [Pseudobutyrivibrio sp.]|nr:YjfB family protein [Pseudobutyrivibrio sp.]